MDLKQMRENTGMSREKLAHKIGVSLGHLLLIENKGRVPSFEVADRLAAYYNMPVEDLFPKYQRLSPHKA